MAEIIDVEGLSEPVFGRVLTAMITPFDSAGKLNLAAAKQLAEHLVDELGNDALVVNGTTGESPTTSDAEKQALVEAVVEAVGERASVIAGVGTNDTAHSLKLAAEAAAVGADGLLAVTPYYSRPPVDALEQHFLTIADATELPIMLYDIPHRSGIAIPEESLIRLGQHPNIAAVKDAKLDVISSSAVMAAAPVQYYAGDDAYLLPLLAVGGVGVVGTSTHFTAPHARAIIEAFNSGDYEAAVMLHRNILPVFRGVFRTQGCMMVKAALNERGFNVGECRAPMGTVPSSLLAAFCQELDTYLVG